MKRIGYYQYRLPVSPPLCGPFLSDKNGTVGDSFTLSYFSYHKIQVTSPPDWFVNPWNGVRCAATDQHWADISDFMSDLGDIKTVWELSRFDWLPRMALAYRGGDESALGPLELWLQDWASKNPVNSGVNWKCGQEASFRCLNLLVAAQVIDDCFENPHKGFLDLLFCHLQRIASTLRYAMAQDNNHGVSEAAALFVVGHYLHVYGDKIQQQYGRKWAKQGCYWLENRVEKLIMTDGSFSQHSVTYHRLMLDVLSLVELLRMRLSAKPFADSFYERIRVAVIWLQRMTDNRTGDAPNIGANDGAYLFNLEEKEYRDFRPSVQLGSAVFLKQAAWTDITNHPLLEAFAFDVQQLPPIAAPVSSLMAEGGYAFLKNDLGCSMLRLPVYRFRPSHADGLHLDLWCNGINWIRDSGTYSYNTSSENMVYFPGTASHSTVCFDGRDQMPRLSRFLFGAWLQADETEWDKEEGFIRSGYTDYLGARHVRELFCKQNSWCVIDTIAGFEHEAIIRWHLAPANWELDGMVLRCDLMKITVESDSNVVLSLVELPESSYYLEQHLSPVLVVKCSTSGVIKTTLIPLQ